MKTTIIKCTNCLKDVQKAYKYAKRHKFGFCNRSCQKEYLKSKNTSTLEKCKNCGKEVSKNNNAKRNSKTGLYFCGNQCKNIYISQNRRWKNKTNAISHKSRVKKIKDAAKHSCQKCNYNADVRMLDIHHNDGNHKNNSFENLRCLCTWCHTKHHRGVEKIENLPVLISENSVQR